MKKKFIKTLVATVTAVTMLMGSSLTAFAAYNDAEDVTVPKVIQAADENVIATSDPSQLYLTGSLMTIHDLGGHPDPQLINNGDGTWTLNMYAGQEVSLGINNPYAAYTSYVPAIDCVSNVYEVEYVDGEYYDGVDWEVSPAPNAYSYNHNFFDENGNRYSMYFGQTDAYNQLYIEGNQTKSVTSSVYYVYVGPEDEWLYAVNDDNGQLEVTAISNLVLLTINVLPGGYNAQSPIYTIQEMINRGLM